MPYFQRKPIEGLVDAVRSQIAIAGMPARGLALPGALTTGTRPAGPSSEMTGIVEQAAAVLAAERPNIGPRGSSRSDTGLATPTHSSQTSQLQEQLNGLIGQLVALAARPPSLDSAALPSTSILEEGPSSEAASSVIEPAPVLAPPGPVAPGGTAQLHVSLVNEDEQPAQIRFVSTGLIGEAGECIARERVSFQPQEVTLQPGATGEVVVRVTVPAQARCGIYSGLIRASRLDYLHAVVVVQVEQS
jgi:hypothetical protein